MRPDELMKTRRKTSAESARPLVSLISALISLERDDSVRYRLDAPLGVLSLAAALKASDIESEVIDLNLTWRRSGFSSVKVVEQALAAVDVSRPKILGLSTICSSYPLTIRISEALKQAFPRMPIVLGGPQASVVDVATLKAFPFVDFVLRGEADETFPRLVASILNRGSFATQPGLTFRDGATIRRNADAAPILDLDSLPLPSFDGLEDLSERRSLPLEIGRGCPFSCRFCSTSRFFHRRYRLKSPGRVIDQMNELSERHGIRVFDLIHDMFTADRHRVIEFCRGLLRLGAPYKWSCSTRTDCVDTELLRTMRRAGCSGIYFGIETGSPRLQRSIRKNLNLRQARAVLKECDRLGIETTASLILGYPDERMSDLQATLAFFRDGLRLDQTDCQLHLLAPLAETSLEIEYRSRLLPPEDSLSSGHFGTIREDSDRTLIRGHPEVFSNFWAFPGRMRPSALCEISDFFMMLSVRCRGLLLALLNGRSQPLELFEEWVRKGRGERRSTRYYERLRFLEDFLGFVRVRFVNKEDVGIDVMWRFYTTLIRTPRSPRSAPESPRESELRPSGSPVWRLSPDVRIVSARGDVVRVLECLKRGRKPGPEYRNRMTTVSIRKASNLRSVISALPPLAAEILGCLDGSEGEIARRLTAKAVRWENRTPAEFVPDALRMLERDGLVRRTASARTEVGRTAEGEACASSLTPGTGRSSSAPPHSADPPVAGR